MIYFYFNKLIENNYHQNAEENKMDKLDFHAIQLYNSTVLWTSDNEFWDVFYFYKVQTTYKEIDLDNIF